MIRLSELLPGEHEGVGYFFLSLVEQGPMVRHVIFIHQRDGERMHMNVLHRSHAGSIHVG